MIIKYTPITDEYTTYALSAPEGSIVLAAIGAEVYVYVPDGETLPEQPAGIVPEPVVLMDDLRARIKEASPHVRLINARVVEKIRSEYSENDEIKLLRESIEHGPSAATQAYFAWVESARAWGREQKARIGL